MNTSGAWSLRFIVFATLTFLAAYVLLSWLTEPVLPTLDPDDADAESMAVMYHGIGVMLKSIFAGLVGGILGATVMAERDRRKSDPVR